MKILKVTITNEEGEVLASHTIIDESSLTSRQVEDLDFYEDNGLSEVDDITRDISVLFKQLKKV